MKVVREAVGLPEGETASVAQRLAARLEDAAQRNDLRAYLDQLHKGRDPKTPLDELTPTQLMNRQRQLDRRPQYYVARKANGQIRLLPGEMWLWSLVLGIDILPASRELLLPPGMEWQD